MHRATILGIAWVVFGLSLAVHEAGHAAAGLLVGGDPTLLSSTDVRGDWSGVSTAGMTMIGVAGFAMNVLLALTGLVALRVGRRLSGSWQLCFWLLLAVNGCTAGLYMALSPVLGFGDWTTIARQYAAEFPLRAAISVVGCLLSLGVLRLVTDTVPDALRRNPETLTPARHDIALTTWLAGGVLAVVAALWSPLGLAWAIPISLGSTLGMTWPILPAVSAAEMLPEERRGDASASLSPSVGWILAGAVVAALFVGALGPGIPL